MSLCLPKNLLDHRSEYGSMSTFGSLKCTLGKDLPPPAYSDATASRGGL